MVFHAYHLCVSFLNYLFIKTLFGMLSVPCILQMVFSLACFVSGADWVLEVMLSRFLQCRAVLELESSGADPESSGAVDLETGGD